VRLNQQELSIHLAPLGMLMQIGEQLFGDWHNR
jgi:hypothetical protein